jgi:signal transduction histidine kinase
MSILAVAVLAVGLFAGPLAYGAGRLYREEAAIRLSREASRAAGVVDHVGPGSSGRVPDLPRPLDHAVSLGLYDNAGLRLSGRGAEYDPVARAATRDGREHERFGGGRVEVAVPIGVGRRDSAVLAFASYDDVVNRTWTALTLMIALAAIVIGVAAVLARRQAGRIAAPLEELTSAARALGTGDFSVRPAFSGLREADEAGRALAATALRLGGLVERERRFSADASHQLRTPLAALRLTIEKALVTPGSDPWAALRAALERVDRVEETITELLAYTRDSQVPAVPVDVGELLRRAVEGRWADVAGAAGRDLDCVCEASLPVARGSETVVNQVLDVLVSNALRHGAGRVLVRARYAVGGVAVEVSDEGAGFDAAAARVAFVRRPRDADGHGIGLALARDLAEAGGSRLVIVHPGPRPVIALLLPAWDPDSTLP